MKKVLKFKTNIKCVGCVSKVTPALNQTVGENNWEVDLASMEKALTIQTENVDAASVVGVLQAAGFRAEAI
ncbi:MAG: heavy-metal-associated domain-containing protein [Saprospiraceae bacterium]|nr:heavy-metal-associated domain-containing protein [Saprospiraceae bacterium]